MEPQDIINWLATLSEGCRIVIGDDGLTIIELDKEDEPTGAYLELGGPPDPDFTNDADYDDDLQDCQEGLTGGNA